MDLVCYADPKEKICLEFYPCKNTGANITWEEWHRVKPLTIFKTDYDKLMMQYLRTIYPTTDPTDNHSEQSFDVCADNRIGKEDWMKILISLRTDLAKVESDKEKEFYHHFISWIEKNLERADIIVVDGNQ